MIYIALGSNLSGAFESSQALLCAVPALLGAAGVHCAGASSLWRSEAFPDPSDPEFLNGVLCVETDLAPHALLAALIDVEKQCGRVRSVPNAPRTLDLDILDYQGAVLDGADLVLPHQRMDARDFVLCPLREVAPAWVHPVSGLFVDDLITGLPQPPQVQKTSFSLPLS